MIYQIKLVKLDSPSDTHYQLADEFVSGVASKFVLQTEDLDTTLAILSQLVAKGVRIFHEEIRPRSSIELGHIVL